MKTLQDVKDIAKKITACTVISTGYATCSVLLDDKLFLSGSIESIVEHLNDYVDDKKMATLIDEFKLRDNLSCKAYKGKVGDKYINLKDRSNYSVEITEHFENGESMVYFTHFQRIEHLNDWKARALNPIMSR